MTDKIQQARRELFEAWTKSEHGNLSRRQDGEYFDDLLQQLAVRDEEIERIRVQLMTIASAEPARHSIEWAKAVAATGNNEVYAKWREAFDERDQQAQRIGELEAVMRAIQRMPADDEFAESVIGLIDATLTTVCAAAPNIATTSEHSGS